MFLDNRTMTTEETQKLLELFEAGYIINISSHYVDSNASIQIADQDIMDDDKGFHERLELGDIVYHSEVYSNYPLKQIEADSVTVSKPVEDWMKEEIS